MDFQAAEEQYRRTCKKFSKSSKVWSLFGEFCMKHGKIDEARQLLQRSLLSLEKRKRGLIVYLSLRALIVI